MRSGVAEEGEGEGDVTLHRSAAERLTALRRHWRPTCELAPTAESAEDKWWVEHTRARLAMHHAGPAAADVESTARRLRSSALGPEGLRLTAWRVAGSVPLRSLCSLFWHRVDDVGSVVSDLAWLPQLAGGFSIAEAAAGLARHESRGRAVPLVAAARGEGGAGRG